MKFTNESIAVLGASRGLGRAFSELLMDNSSGCKFLFVARKKDKLVELIRPSLEVEVMAADFTNLSQQESVLQKINDFSPDRCVYFAAGGPYGLFQDKDWKDHEWALKVSFLFPARLLHFLLQKKLCKQLVFIGSSVAEDQVDPKAASYSAAKHGLKGLVTTVQQELLNSTNVGKLDLRLFSPGYMDTELLPCNARARQCGAIVTAHEIAEKLSEWILKNDASLSHYKI